MTASNKPQDSGEGWWWAWRGWLVASLVWLAVCGWMAREPAARTQGWVGWWTGDATGQGAVRSAKLYLNAGAEIAPAEGDPAFRISGWGFVGLGHWQERRIPWTWAGWVRVNTASGAWPTNFLHVRRADALGSSFALGFKAGCPRAALDTVTAGGGTNVATGRVSMELQSLTPVRVGQWMHLAFSTDGTVLRILVNGVPVAEHSWIGQHGAALHLAALRLGGAVEGEQLLSTRADAISVEHDDVVLYDRAVPAEELAAMAAGGRGAWARELARGQLARRVWQWGWPLALAGMVVLLVLQVRPKLRYWMAEAARELAQPACRPVRWALVGGGLITLVLTVALHRHARESDVARFSELMDRVHGETDLYWQQIKGFLGSARDWVAAQPNLTQERWEAWLKSNHFPHDHPGVIGVGYAEQVLPTDLAAHEARWSARHGFNYRVQPVPGPERERVRELEGNPLLPVVLYGAAELERGKWFTNGSILGRDLLYRRDDDPRRWCEGRRVEAATARNEISTSALESIAPAGWYGEAIEGVRLYVPWTLRTKLDEGPNVPLESAGWRGVLFASVDLRGLLKERFSGGEALIGCRYIAGGLGGEIYDTLADTGELVPATAERADALLRGQLKIPFYHHRLFVEAWTTPAFAAQSMRRWAWIAGACSGGLTLLFATLLLVQARARARQELVLEVLRAANSELLLTYRDREAMSRDLHDGSIQNLYALGLHLQRVQQLLGSAPSRVPGELQNSLELLNQSIAELRRFILTSGVDNVAQSTVSGALETLVDRLRKTTTVEVQLRVAPEAATLEPRIGLQVLNVVREAVSNALRHAGARRIDIRLEPQPPQGNGCRQWTLEVVDDGRGFDQQREQNGNGRGLKNLAARANELAGRSAVESTPGGGTRVTVEFPA